MVDDAVEEPVFHEIKTVRIHGKAKCSPQQSAQTERRNALSLIVMFGRAPIVFVNTPSLSQVPDL